MKWLPALACAISSIACASQKPVIVTALYQNSYCNQPAGVRLITPTEFNALQQPQFSQALDAPSPTIIPSDHYLLMVSLGDKPSGGYGVSLASDKLEVHEQTAVIDLQVLEPEPGSMQTMQLTSPCLVVALPSGDYRWVHTEALPSSKVAIPGNLKP